VVLDTEVPTPKLGKLEYRGVLLDVTFRPLSEFSPPEAVLCSYHLAGSFRTNTLIDDPTGHLAALRDRVSREFGEHRWVLRRYIHATSRIPIGFSEFEPFGPFPEQVLCWLFPTGVTAHVLLTAAQRSPTIRRRYVAVRELLVECDAEQLYEDLLDLLGCRTMSRERVQHHLTELAVTFDATVPIAKTPYSFSSDLTAVARPIAIDGSQAMIDAGDHREAVFWIAVTFARCHTVLDVDAPDLYRERLPAFEALLGDLGILTASAIVARLQAVIGYLPRIRQFAEAMINAR